MDADGFMTMAELDVSDLPPEDRFAAFASLVRSSTVSRRSSGPFHVRARFWQLGTMVISEQWIDPVTFDRTPAHVAAHGSDHYSIVVLNDGECTFHGPSGEQRMGPGRVSLSDFMMPERVDTTAQHSISIQIARRVLDEVVTPVATLGPLPDSPEIQLLVSFCRKLVEMLPAMQTSNALRMAGIVRDLLAAALNNLPPRVDMRPHNRVRERVVRYIAAQPMGSVEVDLLCERLNLTRSSLFRAFRQHGGVLAYDRRRRLHALHQVLTQPGERRSLAELGFIHGFEDKAHLSRLFRKTFGYSASELRDHPVIAQRREPPSGTVQERYRSSVAALSSEHFTAGVARF